MGLYQQIMGRKLPENNLILPLQYFLFGDFHYCVIFVQVQGEMGKGTSKSVYKALVTDMIGQVPLPEISSLKNQQIVLYCPRDNVQSFVNDIISIVKLNQKQIQDYNLRANTVKIKGHSLYISEEYDGMGSMGVDYNQLLYNGYLQLTADPSTLMAILQSSLKKIETDKLQSVVEEILTKNRLVETPFMIGDILAHSVDDSFPKMEPKILLQNVYNMIYTVATYADEGVFLRDLQPDNFRVNNKQQVKLSDPSYIGMDVHADDRFVLFIRQTTPEYLPNVFGYYHRNNKQAELKRYFGEFTEGVCIGMLERVLKRIFLSRYMGKNYDQLYKIKEVKERIATANNLKHQEDLTLFRDEIGEYPTHEQFTNYERNIAQVMREEKIYPEQIITAIARVLVTLRQFSHPVFTENQVHPYLQTQQQKIIDIRSLPGYISQILGLSPVVKAVSPLTQNTRPVSKMAFLAKKYSAINSTKRRTREELLNRSNDVIFEENHDEDDDVIFDSQSSPTEEKEISEIVEKKSETREKEEENIELEISEEVAEILAYIEEQSVAVNKIVASDDLLFITELEQHRKKNKTAPDRYLTGIKQFLSKADTSFQSQEMEFAILRKARQAVSNDIHNNLKPHVSRNYKHYFLSSNALGIKCKKVVVTYLTKIAKYRYILSLDDNKKIEDFLPKPENDIVEFIVKHGWRNIADPNKLADTIIKEVVKG